MLTNKDQKMGLITWNYVLIVIIIFIIYKCLKYFYARPEGFPPGPPKIPIFGSYLFMLMIDKDHLHRAAAKLSEFYKSKIIGIHLANFPTVIVNDYELIKEVLNRKDFDGRPDLHIARMRDPQFKLRGIFFTDDSDWLEQRRFILRYLRDFGFGRRFDEHEREVENEIKCLVEMMKEGIPKFEHEKEFLKNGYVLCPNIFMACFGNSFLQILCGERTDRAEQKAMFEAGKNAMVFQRNGDDYGTIFSMWDFSKYLFWTKYNRIRNSNRVTYNFLKTIVDRFLESHEDDFTRNFLDLYFNELKKNELPKDLDHNFSFQYDQLLLACLDFFFPSISGATTQIALLIQRLLLNPHILEKMQKEIDEVVGHGRLPNLDDRIDLPYTEATIRESMRIDTLVPSGIGHKASVDTELGGYKISKGTIVITTLDYMHNQKEIWENPDNFQPERFLGPNGKLALEKDKSLPFGAGRRLCAGETFARNTMFLIVSALAQNFNLRQPPNDKLPDMKNVITGVIISPEDFWVKFESR